MSGSGSGRPGNLFGCNHRDKIIERVVVREVPMNKSQFKTHRLREDIDPKEHGVLTKMADSLIWLASQLKKIDECIKDDDYDANMASLIGAHLDTTTKITKQFLIGDYHIDESGTVYGYKKP